MSDLQEKKKGPPRYPLMSVKQAKSTLARLTRDLLNKKIDVQTYRAAAYGLSVQCSLLKFETPEKTDNNITIIKPDFSIMNPQEREERMTEILRKKMPYYDEYIEYAKRKEDEKNSDKINPQEIEEIKNTVELHNILEDISDEGIDDPVEKVEKTESPKKETEQPPAPWKQSGIGVKRG